MLTIRYPCIPELLPSIFLFIRLKQGLIAFLINLSYHASGIRVAQEATWVGLGWCLNAGGVITRTIRGKDDLGTGYYYNETDIPDVVDGSVDSGVYKNVS